MAIDGKIHFTPISEGTHTIPADEFEDDVESLGGYCSDDGIGFWATDTLESDVSVWRTSKPEWATQVCWYNV